MRVLSSKFKVQSSKFFLLSLALLLSAACRLPPAASAQTQTPANNWYQFRGNQQLTGLSAHGGLPDKLSVKWSFDMGGEVESSAAIVGETVLAASQKGELVALNLADGKVWWRFKVDPVGESSPAYNGNDGLAYIGDLTGWLNAVNARTGQKAWAFKTGSEIKSSPVYVDGKVLIGSYDEHLYCLNAKTGQLLWKARTGGPVHATPSIGNGVAYIAGCDEQFRALRLADGKEVFASNSGNQGGASPVLSGNYAIYGTFGNDVLAMDVTTGKLAWRYAPQDRQFPFYSSAAVAYGRVVVGGRDKRVHCLNAANGQQLWTFTTRARVESSPAIVGSRAYVGSNDGRLYVLDLNNGAKVFEFNAGGAVSASPAIASGRLVVGSVDGRLYCLG
jgi:outer membrane protein assembly factor BamB